VLDAHQRAKLRIAAFGYVVLPSLNRMLRLLSVKTTPRRLRLTVAETRASSLHERGEKTPSVRNIEKPRWRNETFPAFG
jgi:hypothetical protein